MRLLFLNTSGQGLQWFRQYYSDRPELDAGAAFASFEKPRATIRAFPYAGQKFPDVDGVFEKKIVKTAFSVLYTVRDETIFVIDVSDQRGLRSAAAIRAFQVELTAKLSSDRS